MNYDVVKQMVLLVQDAKQIGWDFEIEDGHLKAVDENHFQDSYVFHSESQFLEWLEEQFDKQES